MAFAGVNVPEQRAHGLGIGQRGKAGVPHGLERFGQAGSYILFGGLGRFALFLFLAGVNALGKQFLGFVTLGTGVFQ
ncbi:hypothetical protein AGMMS49925_09470 [Deltaproteobacteria bacterium]|nr:hypothetical protein AGMMS49925_09470 [Deltaproteobacteria bacterium]